MLSLTFATGNRAKRSATSPATFRWRVKTLNPAGIDPSLSGTISERRSIIHKAGRLRKLP
jgi:hypothetical protein